MGNKIFSKNIFICRNTKNPRETYKLGCPVLRS